MSSISTFLILSLAISIVTIAADNDDVILASRRVLTSRLSSKLEMRLAFLDLYEHFIRTGQYEPIHIDERQTRLIIGELDNRNYFLDNEHRAHHPVSQQQHLWSLKLFPNHHDLIGQVVWRRVFSRYSSFDYFNNLPEPIRQGTFQFMSSVADRIRDAIPFDDGPESKWIDELINWIRHEPSNYTLSLDDRRRMLRGRMIRTRAFPDRNMIDIGAANFLSSILKNIDGLGNAIDVMRVYMDSADVPRELLPGRFQFQSLQKMLRVIYSRLSSPQRVTDMMTLFRLTLDTNAEPTLERNETTMTTAPQCIANDEIDQFMSTVRALGHDIFAPHEFGRQLLQDFIENGDWDKLRILNYAPDVVAFLNRPDDRGRTALQYAIDVGGRGYRSPNRAKVINIIEEFLSNANADTSKTIVVFWFCPPRVFGLILICCLLASLARSLFSPSIHQSI